MFLTSSRLSRWAVVVRAAASLTNRTTLSQPLTTSRVEAPRLWHANCTMTGCNKDPRRAVAMFRLDYLSCFLTVVATILVGKKMWTGLVVSGVNSLIVCVIGLHTSQYGFIPANVFCICINAFNLRAWLKLEKDLSEIDDWRKQRTGRWLQTNEHR